MNILTKGDPTDDYELLQRVGSGTYGEVYKAKHNRTGEFAAVKVVKLEAGDNFVVIQQEILMIRDCVHPNIIAYNGSYLRRDRLWIVMEYCGGGSLQDIYHMTGPLSELQIAFVCRETLRGLRYLHWKGMIHRDVKGANILLTHLGDVKLADFGIAAQISATIGKRKSFIGTPYWMAPEVACVERRGGYGAECDVWAVGITAIELAELQPPLFDLHPMQVLSLMMKSSYKPPTLKEKYRWSPFFHDFVKQCLTKNPKKRPTPEKLLSTHHFVLGALSSRMTRDLLDKVNNHGRSSHALISHTFFSEAEDEDDGIVPDKLARIKSRGNADVLAAQDAIRVSGQSNILLSKIWSDLSTSEGSKSAKVHRRYCEEKTLPVKEQAPLSDIVQALSSVGDGNEGTFNANGSTMRAVDHFNRDGSSGSEFAIPQRPPRIKKNTRRSSSLESPHSINSSKVIHRQNVCASSEMPRPVTCFGLPPTPKVTMGACFSLIFHDCPLHINSTSSWINPNNWRQFIIVGAEEGIFTLDLDELHDASMVLLHKKRCSWVYVHKNVLMAVQGKTSYLYQHDLLAFTEKNLTQKISKPITKVPEKFLPKKFAVTTRLIETKDTIHCNAARSGINGNIYLCCATPSAVILFQWYDPLAKFLLLKTKEMRFPFLPLLPFQLIYCTGSEADFPKVCLSVYKISSRKYYLDYVNFNEERPHDAQKNFCAGLRLNVIALKQIDKDALLLCYDNMCVVINQEGIVKSSRISPAQFEFSFHVQHLVPITDSILAFHSHGVQGRSYIDGSITQDVNDTNYMYQVVGSDKLVLLRRCATKGAAIPCDLCILTGHESTLAR